VNRENRYQTDKRINTGNTDAEKEDHKYGGT
jgi:hypothetical protein